MTRARFKGVVDDQAGNAALAAATAVFTSSGLANATRADSLPVAGLNTAELLPLLPGTMLPLI